MVVQGCSGNNQSWRTVCLREDDDAKALEAKVGLVAHLVVVLLDLVQCDAIVVV
jgi:hypothetical protein